MSLLENRGDGPRVTSDLATPRRRNEDLGTSENPIVLSPSPIVPRITDEISAGRTPQPVTRTSRRKCPLGAYVEIIEDSRPVRSQSVESCNVVAARGADPSVQCPLTAATEAVTNSSDSSQPPPTGNGKVQSSPNQETATNEVKSNQCLIVPQNFEILMRCAICMEIFHNPANVTPCNHKFCYSCLISWKRTNQTAHCPQCRGPIQGMEKDAQFNEVVQSFLVTNPTKRRSSSELEALDAAEADYVSYQNRGHARTRRRGSVPQTRSRTSAERIIRSPFVVRVSHIRAHRAPLTNRQRGEQGILEDWLNI